MRNDIDELVKWYIAEVYKEMERRGLDTEQIERVIGKTGFRSAIEKYPEEQLHYDVSDAVDEILLVAATH